MSKNASKDLAHGLADDLRDVADDLRGIVETVVVPKVGSAMHAAAERVPADVVDRLPASVADHLPVKRRRRGRKLLLAGGLMALGAAAFALARRAEQQRSSQSSESSEPSPAYPRPVADDPATDALDDPVSEPFGTAAGDPTQRPG